MTNNKPIRTTRRVSNNISRQISNNISRQNRMQTPLAPTQRTTNAPARVNRNRNRELLITPRRLNFNSPIETPVAQRQEMSNQYVRGIRHFRLNQLDHAEVIPIRLNFNSPNANVPTRREEFITPTRLNFDSPNVATDQERIITPTRLDMGTPIVFMNGTFLSSAMLNFDSPTGSPIVFLNSAFITPNNS